MSRLFKLLLVLMLVGSAAGPALTAPLVLTGRTATLSASASGAPSSPWRSLLRFAGVAALGLTVKATSDAAAKFVSRAAAAAPDYGKAVGTAGQHWLDQTTAADGNWAAGVNAAATAGRFKSGVVKKGSTKYQTNASTLGAQRYGPGVQNAQNAYAAGVDPYLQLLKGLNLPARGPKGQNAARANAVAVELRKKKVGG